MRQAVLIGGVALIAAGWELAEVVSDKFMGTDLHVSMAETLKDFVLSLVGAAPGAWKLAAPRFPPQDL
jgi:hypothetical protein